MSVLKKIIIKINIFLLATLLLLGPQIVYAINVGTVGSVGAISGFASPSSVLDEMLYQDLGLDENETKNTVETMNVSRQKKNPPAVSLYFNPPNPEFGEKITATAVPVYFLNKPKDLYYTWFLKPKKCPDKEDNNYDRHNIKAGCDLDGDGDVDIKDEKIRAMRTIATGGFDNHNVDYNNAPNDNDGYQATWGGDDQKGKDGHCFIHDIKKGDEYEIDCDKHLFPNAPGETTGNGSFGKSEEEFWGTDTASADTAHSGNTDEANVVGLGMNTFTWNYIEGDKVGVVVEGVSFEATQEQDASYKTMWAAPNGLCKDLKVSTDIADDYPKTTITNTTTTLDSPVAGQTTTVEEITYETISYSGNYQTIKTYEIEKTTITITATGALVSEVMIDPNDVDKDGDPKVITAYTDATYTSVTSQISADSFDIENISKVSDLNKCLYDSLVTPSEMGNQSNKLDVNLFSSPLSPINDTAHYSDPSLSQGDSVEISSSIANAKNLDYVKYVWSVYLTDDPDPSQWGNPLTKNNIKDSTQTSGIGLSTFKFKMNFENPKKYLIVKVNASENVGDDLYREGNANVIIPILSSEDQIEAHKVLIDNNLHLSMSDELCLNSDGTKQPVCEVLKDQIIGLKIDNNNLSDFMWTINDQPFTYKECFFAGCDLEKQTKVAYFPILKDPGESYTIGLSAINQETGDKVNLTKNFKVVEPEIRINSEDSNVCAPMLLGNYIDTKGATFEDYSKLNYWAITGNDIKLSASSPNFSPAPENFTWNIDGGNINTTDTVAYPTASFDNSGTLTLSPLDADGNEVKELGQSYNITASVLYSPSDLTKQALQKYWNVTYNQLYEKVALDDAIITMYDSNPTAIGPHKTKVFASVYSSLPSYLAFLLRIILTIFLILFVSKLVFSFFPKNTENF